VEPHGLARHISWRESPWHHVVSPIRFANGGPSWYDIPLATVRLTHSSTASAVAFCERGKTMFAFMYPFTHVSRF